MLGLLHLLLAPNVNAQVTATLPNGPTNPEKPEFLPVGSQVNQTSLSRLLSLNGVDDFCLYGPPEPGPDSLIGNVEPIVVAYCTKPRNNARLIPDGAITGAHFVKTPLYVQIHGFWDGTKVNIPANDAGGELDPWGAENLGNPIGGNVTTNVATGSDVFYQEWMSFISYDQFCLRICTAQSANVTADLQCEHELDIMGCAWVMAIPDFYSTDKSFTSCDGDAAPPPGLYPQADGSTSTFRQRYTGTYTDGSGSHPFTVGQTVTPSAPAYYPKSSNCVTYSSIANGVDPANLLVTAAPSLFQSGSTVAVSGVATTSVSATPISGAASGSARTSGASASASSAASGSALPSGSNSAASQGASSGAASSGAAGRSLSVNSTPYVLAAAVGGVGALIGAMITL